MTQQPEDSYLTIRGEAEARNKDKGSKFLAYAFHVENEEQIREHLDTLRKKYYDATHHCYAWRLGPRGETFRTNDDGEPSSTAGRPILGQMLSKRVTDTLIIVVRYFGGTKLGVPGLINAYREAAAEVLEEAVIEVRTVDLCFTIYFGYEAINDVMRIVKEMQPTLTEQFFDNICRMGLRIRQSRAEFLRERLEKVEGLNLEQNK